MSPSAQLLHTAFARLAGDPNGLLYFSEFFRAGFHAWPDRMRRRFPQLAPWAGLADLKLQLRNLIGANEADDVLLAGRSRALLHQTLSSMMLHCERVLTVDLLWPPYRKLLELACRSARKDLIVVRLVDSAFRHCASTDQLAARICEAYVSHKCDGLMLPVIDHRGVQLPIAKLVKTLQSYGPVRFVIADAAQALGHLPLNFSEGSCDVLIAGCHKWLGGYHPLGVAVTSSSGPSSIAALRSSQRRGRPVNDDPLHRFVYESEGRIRIRHGETAALIPLLTACGALVDTMTHGLEHRLAVRESNRRWLSHALGEIGWHLLRPAIGPANGMLIARPPARCRSTLNHSQIQDAFAAYGVALTVYRQGLVRFSLPSITLFGHERVRLLTACHEISGRAVAIQVKKIGHDEDLLCLLPFLGSTDA
jgi:hypothetical protein